MRIGAIPDGLVERLGLLSARCRRRSASRCSRCRSRARCRSRSGPGSSPRWPRGRRPELPSTSACKRLGTSRVLDVIATLGHVRQTRRAYEISRAPTAGWTPPPSTYLGDFLADTARYWEW